MSLANAAKTLLSPEEQKSRLAKPPSIHYDLRIQKGNAKVWFGYTFRNKPWEATVDKPILAIPKGAEMEVPESEKKQAELTTDKILGPAGTENFGNLKWMDVWKEITFPSNTPGNPTVNYVAKMKGIDKGKIVVHRREPDFLDITFEGGLLKGRYFIRRISGKDGERTVIWKAKNQVITEEEIQKKNEEQKKQTGGKEPLCPYITSGDIDTYGPCTHNPNMYEDGPESYGPCPYGPCPYSTDSDWADLFDNL